MQEVPGSILGYLLHFSFSDRKTIGIACSRKGKLLNVNAKNRPQDMLNRPF